MDDLLTGLVDFKTLSVLKIFLDDPRNLFHISKVSKQANVPLATTFRIINNLTKNRFIKVTAVGKLKLYSLANNDKTRRLEKL